MDRVDGARQCPAVLLGEDLRCERVEGHPGEHYAAVTWGKRPCGAMISLESGLVFCRLAEGHDGHHRGKPVPESADSIEWAAVYDDGGGGAG